MKSVSWHWFPTWHVWHLMTATALKIEQSPGGSFLDRKLVCYVQSNTKQGSMTLFIEIASSYKCYCTHQLSSLINSSGFLFFISAFNLRACGYKLKTCSNWFAEPSAKNVEVSFTEAIVITTVFTLGTREQQSSFVMY